MTRPGPGKFEGNESLEESELLYGHSLDGTHDTFGESDLFGFYILIIREYLPHSDQTRLSYPAYICKEDEHGFFSVIPYSDPKEAEAMFLKWAQEWDSLIDDGEPI